MHHVFATPKRLRPGTLCGVIALLAVASVAPAAQESPFKDLGAIPRQRALELDQRCRTSYEIHLEDPQTQIVEIRIVVERVESDYVDFVLPTWRPGKYKILDFAGAITHVEARGEKELPIEKVGKTTWRVATRGQDAITLSYRVYANELALRTRHVDDTHAFLSGSSVFMEVRGRRKEPLRVSIHAPEGWRVGTGLDPHPTLENALIVPCFDALIDSPIEIGEHESWTFEVEGHPHELVIWGRGNFDAQKLRDDLQALVKAHIDFWQGVPYGRYVFLLHATSGAAGGTEHLNSTIMQLPRHIFAHNYRRFLGLASHEFFHTWNVKSFRPRGLSPYHLTVENYTDLLWVCEGTTSYYTPLLLVRAELQKPSRYLKSLETSIASYRRRPGRKVQSLAMSSHDAWTTFNKPHANSHNTTVSFYSKGALVSLLLDLEIRHLTDARGSLDDVMRLLYQRFPVGSPGFTRGDLVAIIQEVSGHDFTPFFRAYVEGTEPLPFESHLAYAGLELKREDKPEKKPEDIENAADNVDPADKAYLGVSLSDANGLARVSRVAADGPAYRAGIQAEDLVVALDGLRLRASEKEDRLATYRPGDVIQLTLLRRDVLKRIKVPLASRDERRWIVSRVESPDDKQRRIYETWLEEAWPTSSSVRPWNH